MDTRKRKWGSVATSPARSTRHRIRCNNNAEVTIPDPINNIAK